MSPPPSATGRPAESLRPGRHWAAPRLDADRRWIGGVATGLAGELGVDPLLVRTALVGLTLVSPIWPILYAIGYLVLLVRQSQESPRAVPAPTIKGRDIAVRHLGFFAVVAGLVPLSQAVDALTALDSLMPVGLVLLGATLAWSRGGHAAQSPTLRLIVGVGLVLVGLVVLLTSGGITGDTVRLAGLVVLIAAGLGLLAGPWLYHTAHQLNEERAARIRADEKSQIATHLHDSVLQTLSLIQKNADDPARTLQLARRQERQLRDWLYGPPDGADGTISFRALLARIVDEVEELHGTAIESVVVGDAAMGDDLVSMLRAAREALVNAAEHSGADRIDVYAELGRDTVEIFVRDTGVGFDPGAVTDMRRGLKDSIHGRMERLGGRAIITSEPGEGTEVELHLYRPETPTSGAADAEAQPNDHQRTQR